jgi:hypothetical protein
MATATAMANLPKPSGETTVHRDEKGVVWVHLSGHVSAVQVEAGVQLAAASREPATGYVIDCQDVTSYAANVREPGKRLLEVLRARGAERGVCVTSSSVVRMMASAVAFVMGMPVRFAATRDEAHIVLVREVLWRRMPETRPRGDEP